MDGSMGERSAEKKSSVVTLPCMYLEDLDNCSSPGVVSKKAAYFEEVIRSASGEKKCSGSSLRRTGTGPRSVSKIDEAELASLKDTATVRTLDFSSDSEGSSVEAENRPPEVNKQSEAAAQEQSTLLQTKGAADDETVLPQPTKPSETGGLCEVPEEEIKVVVTGSSHVQLSQDLQIDGTGLVDVEKDGGLVSSSSEEVLKERKAPECEQVPEAVVADSSSKKVKVAPKKVAETKVKGGSRGPTSSQVKQQQQHKHREAVRSSASEFRVLQKAGASRSLNPVSKSTSFTTPQPFALATEKRRSETRVKPTSSQIPTRHAAPPPPPSKQASTSSKDAARRSVSEFHLKSEERAGKRKEFYLKLEERVSAKEQERNQMRVKSQEVMESEYRKLRQSLAFKAKPMPSFYQESPPKSEVKKAPTTRAVSPKLGRHKSGTSEADSSNHQHHHHHVRLCQQQQPRSGTIPVRNSRRLSETRRISKVSPVKVEEGGKSSRKTWEAVDGKQVVAGDEDCSILDLKEEDETLLFGASNIAEVSCFSQRQL